MILNTFMFESCCLGIDAPGPLEVEVDVFGPIRVEIDERVLEKVGTVVGTVERDINEI